MDLSVIKNHCLQCSTGHLSSYAYFLKLFIFYIKCTYVSWHSFSCMQVVNDFTTLGNKLQLH